MIQIERPVAWSIDNILKLANEIKWIEIYNAKLVNKLEVSKLKWEVITN